MAIKVLPLRTFRERAEAEAEVATIDHPRLLAVHDRVVDERRGVVGLVMDLATEGDLRTALRGSSAPSPIEMVQITDDVLAALETLHASGLVHRDIKPENVMLERVDGQLRARLGDMGIARPIDRTRSTGSVLGTDLYIAPEVHDGALPSPAADLWAVGYVLYEGLFGAPPHASATTSYQAIGRLRTDGPDRPPNVPDAMWNVVAALLAPRPDDRPADARAARELLDSARPTAEAASAAFDPSPSPSAAVRRVSNRRQTTAFSRSDPPRPSALPERRARVTRVFAGVSALVVVVTGIAWLGNRNLTWFSDGAETLGAVRSLTPMPTESDVVVPTQYQWRLQNGVLNGRLDVSNPSTDSTPATEISELFPSSALHDGVLALVGNDGPTERQNDGSVLARFTIPSLAPKAHHVVAFRVTLPDDDSDRVVLSELVRDRDAAITRHALALSDAPTLADVGVDLVAAINVGQRVDARVTGLTKKGGPAPADLLTGARLEIIGAGGIARTEGLSIVGLAAGTVVVRAIVGDLHADVPLSVLAVDKPKVTTRVTPRVTRPQTTITTLYEEPAPPPAPKDVTL